jgi:WD40 repeat protein
VLTTFKRLAHIWQADGRGAPVILGERDAEICCAAFSPNGAQVVVVTDTTAEIYRSDRKGPPVLLNGHTKRINSAQFSPDGSSVVTSSYDMTARVWSVERRGDPIVLRGHVGAVMRASFSRDGSRIVTGANDGTARVWRLDNPGEPVVLQGHDDPEIPDRLLDEFFETGGRVEVHATIKSLAFSADGSHVVTAADDHTARIWHVGWRTLLARLRASTTACLGSEERMSYLAEPSSVAAARYSLCEKRNVVTER